MNQKILNKIGYLLISLVIAFFTVFKIRNRFSKNDFIIVPIVAIFIFILIDFLMKSIRGEKMIFENLENQTNNNLVLVPKTKLNFIVIGSIQEDQYGLSSAVSKDGSTIAFGTKSRLYIYTNSNNINWTVIGNIQIDSAVQSIAISNDGQMIVIGLPEYKKSGSGIIPNIGAVRVYEYNDTSYVKIAEKTGSQENEGMGACVKISDDGKIIAYSSNTNFLKVFSFQNNNFMDQIGSDIPISNNNFDMTPDGTKLALLEDDKVSVLGRNGNDWNIIGTKIDNKATSLSLSNDGKRLAISNSIYESFIVYNFTDDWNDYCFGQSNIDTDNFGKSLALSGDGNLLLVGDPQAINKGNGFVSLYDVSYENLEDPREPIYKKSGPIDNSQYGYSCSISNDGRVIAIGAKNFSNNNGSVGQGVINMLSYQYLSPQEILEEERMEEAQRRSELRNEKCPQYGKAPKCPPGTQKCSNKEGYCYYPSKKQMVSTYFTYADDYCPEVGEGNYENQPFNIGETRVWKKYDGLNPDCQNIYQEEESFIQADRERLKVVLRNIYCPSGNNAPPCPPGTTQCGNRKGYCYDPDSDQMISTFYNIEEDHCNETDENPSGGNSFYVGGTRVWSRKLGKDLTCTDAYRPGSESDVENIVTIRDEVCPTMDNAPECPQDTYKCSNRKGYCYDEESDQMVSTYFDISQDYCPDTLEGNSENKPYTINGTRVWKKQGGYNEQCENPEATTNEPVEIPTALAASISPSLAAIVSQGTNQGNLQCYAGPISPAVAQATNRVAAATSSTAAEPSQSTSTLESEEMTPFLGEFLDSDAEKLRLKALYCPAKGYSPNCPPGTSECLNKQGYCFDPASNRMVTTYYTERDYCPEINSGDISRKPFSINGIRVWEKSNQYDSSCGFPSAAIAATIAGASTTSTTSPVQVQSYECPPEGVSPVCPVGTIPCENKNGYCYDPVKNGMVSTYFQKANDYCPETLEGNLANSPYSINGTRVWTRKENSGNMCGSSTSIAPSSPSLECPIEGVSPICPVGTIPCGEKKGYCYDPTKNSMVSTYFQKANDYCPESLEGNLANNPYSINGTRVWTRQKNSGNLCQTSRAAPAPAPSSIATTSQEPFISPPPAKPRIQPTRTSAILAKDTEVILAAQENRNPDLQRAVNLAYAIESERNGGILEGVDIYSTVARSRAYDIAKKIGQSRNLALTQDFDKFYSSILSEETGFNTSARLPQRQDVIIPSAVRPMPTSPINALIESQNARITADQVMSQANVANIRAMTDENTAKQSQMLASITIEPAAVAKAKADVDAAYQSRQEAQRLFEEATDLQLKAKQTDSYYRQVSKATAEEFVAYKGVQTFEEEYKRAPIFTQEEIRRDFMREITKPTGDPSMQMISPSLPAISPSLPIAPISMAPSGPAAPTTYGPPMMAPSMAPSRPRVREEEATGYDLTARQRMANYNYDKIKPISINVAYNNNRPTSINSLKDDEGEGKGLIKEFAKMLKESSLNKFIFDSCLKNDKTSTLEQRKPKIVEPSKKVIKKTVTTRRIPVNNKGPSASPTVVKRTIYEDHFAEEEERRGRMKYRKEERGGLGNLDKEELFRRMRNIAYPQNISREIKGPTSIYENDYETRNKEMRDVLRAQDNQSNLDKLKYDDESAQMNYEVSVIKKIMNEKANPAPVLLENPWSEFSSVS